MGYKKLRNQCFRQGDYSIVPIRFEDRFDIMKWRNEQIYHLRQSEPLTEEMQDNYFNNVVSKLSDQEKPSQLLFSYLENEKCIGYGGLVHINWIDKNAEVSFIMDTDLEKNSFKKHWGIFLGLLEIVAFEELELHKIFTYAFDVRPHLYKAIEAKGFYNEATLKEHCLFNGVYKDVLIHSKINRNIILRKITQADKEATYKWANDKLTRINSFNSDHIKYEGHCKWFDHKLEDVNALYYICELNGTAAGLVRFDKKEEYIIVGITVAPEFRQQKLASEFLRKGCEKIRENFTKPIVAYIKKDNKASVKSFEKSGFEYSADIKINGIDSYEYILKHT